MNLSLCAVFFWLDQSFCLISETCLSPLKFNLTLFSLSVSTPPTIPLYSPFTPCFCRKRSRLCVSTRLCPGTPGGCVCVKHTEKPCGECVSPVTPVLAELTRGRAETGEFSTPSSSQTGMERIWHCWIKTDLNRYTHMCTPTIITALVPLIYLYSFVVRSLVELLIYWMLKAVLVEAFVVYLLSLTHTLAGYHSTLQISPQDHARGQMWNLLTCHYYTPVRLF